MPEPPATTAAHRDAALLAMMDGDDEYKQPSSETGSVPSAAGLSAVPGTTALDLSGAELDAALLAAMDGEGRPELRAVPAVPCTTTQPTTSMGYLHLPDGMMDCLVPGMGGMGVGMGGFSGEEDPFGGDLELVGE